MATTAQSAIAVIGIDIGKNSFHVVGSRWSWRNRAATRSGRVARSEARFANMSPCLIGMEACVGAHHLNRKLKALGLMRGRKSAESAPETNSLNHLAGKRKQLAHTASFAAFTGRA